MNTITQTEIDNLPHPPQEWLDEINKQLVIDNITNIDMKKEFNRVMKHYKKESYNMYSYKYGLDGLSSASSSKKNLYGKTHYDTLTIFNEISVCKFCNKEKYGIEILGMKPSNKTADGKFKYEGVSIKDLKQYCKNNGLKKYSKHDKIGLVQLLISI
tara:strand:- start:1594 stop:2064 length:471 start_codon:yes stop_codon:yes gene_type:complete